MMIMSTFCVKITHFCNNNASETKTKNEYLENRSINLAFQYAINFQRIEHILKRRRR